MRIALLRPTQANRRAPAVGCSLHASAIVRVAAAHTSLGSSQQHRTVPAFAPPRGGSSRSSVTHCTPHAVTHSAGRLCRPANGQVLGVPPPRDSPSADAPPSRPPRRRRVPWHHVAARELGGRASLDHDL
eukprot:scaffold272786_cov27-Tisochrysis_lutea.AAC.4